MNISDYLNKDRISLNLSARTKEEAIRKLSLCFKGSSEVIDHAIFLNDIFEREGMRSTAIGNAIAIPHARTKGVNDFVIAFGRINQGMDFDSLDSNPVNLIFLMGTPKEKKLNGYLTILAKLTRLLSHKSFRDLLMKAKDAEEVIDAFKEMEKQSA